MSDGPRKKVSDGTVEIKAMSVNQCWQGRRYKTKKYSQYEKDLLDILPSRILIPTKGPMKLYIRFGHSNPAFDWDNGIKPFQDVLQKRYGFNDKRIYLAIVEKEIVPKGKEYIYFKISRLTLLERAKELIKEIFDD